MSLKQVIQTSAKQAFVIAGDLIEEVDYVAQIIPGYDAESGEVIDSQNMYKVHMVFGSYGALFGRDPTMIKEGFSGKLAGYALADDGTPIAEQDIKLLRGVPRTNDLVIRDGEKLKITGSRADPTKTLYTFLLDKA